MPASTISPPTSPPAAEGHRSRPEGISWSGVAVFGGLVAAASVIGSLATTPTVESEWFAQLDKPSFYPPDAVFGPVWTVLYIMIAVAGYRAWRRSAPPAAMAAWGVQLALNLGWSLIFFGLRSPNWALVEIVALGVAIGVTIEAFRRVDRVAALLLVPYAAWVAFATLLNASIVGLN